MSEQQPRRRSELYFQKYPPLHDYGPSFPGPNTGGGPNRAQEGPGGGRDHERPENGIYGSLNGPGNGNNDFVRGRNADGPWNSNFGPENGPESEEEDLYYTGLQAKSTFFQGPRPAPPYSLGPNPTPFYTLGPRPTRSYSLDPRPDTPRN